MKTVLLYRHIPTKEGTFGHVLIPDFNWCCASLEPEWYYNQKDISCINAGDYRCKYTLSPRLDYETYELQNVENHDGIRIHLFNYVSETTGCIGLGRIESIFHNRRCILDSEATVNEFEKLLDYKDFLLKIRWLNE